MEALNLQENERVILLQCIERERETERERDREREGEGDRDREIV